MKDEEVYEELLKKYPLEEERSKFLFLSVRDELLSSEFYQDYKKEVEFNAMRECSDEEVICELLYDLVRTIDCGECSRKMECITKGLHKRLCIGGAT